MQLDDQLTARLTARFGMRIPQEYGDRLSAYPKTVGVAAGAEIAPQTLERLLRINAVPCAWSFHQDDEMAYFRVYYVGAVEGDHGHA